MISKLSELQNYFIIFYASMQQNRKIYYNNNVLENMTSCNPGAELSKDLVTVQPVNAHNKAFLFVAGDFSDESKRTAPYYSAA
jgi:hypothetical protein